MLERNRDSLLIFTRCIKKKKKTQQGFLLPSDLTDLEVQCLYIVLIAFVFLCVFFL